MDTKAKSRRILVVEDEPVIATVAQRVLTAMGFEVDIAINGNVAQDMLDKKHYDFCLVDIRTPEMNGKELYQWMKEKHPRMAAHVIFTTGDLMSGDIEAFFKQSGRLFLPKPFSPDELEAIVKQALLEEEKK